MSRYKNITTRVNNKNKSYYSTTYYKEVVERNDDMYFISQHGDRCDTLALRFYGDTRLWWFIARVNHIKSMNIPAGTRLRIPSEPRDAEGF
jgi:hypothetical protein